MRLFKLLFPFTTPVKGMGKENGVQYVDGQEDIILSSVATITLTI